MVGCELGGGQKICFSGGGGGAIDVIGIIVVVDQLKALDLELDNILPTPIRWTRHISLFCVPCLVSLTSPNLIRNPLPLKR